MARMHQRLDFAGVRAVAEALRPLLGWALLLRMHGAPDGQKFNLPLPTGLAMGDMQHGLPTLRTVVAAGRFTTPQNLLHDRLTLMLGEPLRMPRLAHVSPESIEKITAVFTE
jgi:hypothetical protein